MCVSVLRVVPVLCMAYSLVVRMLLLLSGDVERNPGPETSERKNHRRDGVYIFQYLYVGSIYYNVGVKCYLAGVAQLAWYRD